MKSKVEIFETRMMKNGWEEYTGRFRARIITPEGGNSYFEIPGRGGRVSRNAANRIRDLWDEGKTAGEITSLTGFCAVG